MLMIYGADWCHDTRDTLKHLDSLGVEYEYKDVEADPSAADWVKAKNSGKRKLPTLDVEGEILSVPDVKQLEAALRAKGLMPPTTA